MRPAPPWHARAQDMRVELIRLINEGAIQRPAKDAARKKDKEIAEVRCAPASVYWRVLGHSSSTACGTRPLMSETL